MIWIISYTPFWDTIKEKEISTYSLIEDYKVSKSLIDKLKHNKGINTSTLNQLCNILDCKLSEIAEYKPEKE
ncbi:MAG: helix-turn-helix domain-containing protein [Mobilitalea sp.]